MRRATSIQNTNRRAALEDWLLEEQRRHVERLLAPAAAATLQAAAATRPADALSIPPSRAAACAGRLLALGACAASFGAVLLIWGCCAGRAELWRVGLPAALVGQLLVWIGFRMPPRGAALAAAGADSARIDSARADYPPTSVVWPASLPIFPPLPPLRVGPRGTFDSPASAT